MIPPLLDDIALCGIALGAVTVEYVRALPVAQRLGLRAAALVLKDVRVRPAGGNRARAEADAILRQYYDEMRE